MFVTLSYVYLALFLPILQGLTFYDNEVTAKPIPWVWKIVIYANVSG